MPRWPQDWHDACTAISFYPLFARNQFTAAKCCTCLASQSHCKSSAGIAFGASRRCLTALLLHTGTVTGNFSESFSDQPILKARKTSGKGISSHMHSPSTQGQKPGKGSCVSVLSVLPCYCRDLICRAGICQGEDCFLPWGHREWGHPQLTKVSMFMHGVKLSLPELLQFGESQISGTEISMSISSLLPTPKIIFSVCFKTGEFQGNRSSYLTWKSIWSIDRPKF